MANFLKIIFIVLIFSIRAYCTPVISTISSSNVQDNLLVTLNGSGFGSNDLDIEWLGGPSGNIESGTIGSHFSKTGWSADPDCEVSACQSKTPIYSSEYSHSGTKSILSIIKDGAGYCAGIGADDNCITSSFEYTAPTEGGGYMSWWVRFHDDSGVFEQWKMWRVMCVGSLNVSDLNTHLMGSQWYNDDGTNFQSYSVDFYTCGANQNTTYAPGTIIYQDQWARQEVIIVPGTPGHFTYRSYRNGSVFVARDADINLDSTNMKYWMFQNYVGNHTDGAFVSDAYIYIDDIYISLSTSARIELADTSSWSSRTHSEIQCPATWNNNEITFNVNQGSFSLNDTAYVFVIDSNGTPNATGETVTFTSGGGASAPSPRIGTSGPAMKISSGSPVTRIGN